MRGSAQAPAASATLADVLLPDRTWAVEAALVLGVAALTALSAQLSIRLWFTPVPITGQTFAFLLAGAAVGRWRGLVGELVYVLAGVIGLPIFAGASGGLAALVGPSGGYLLGGAVCAYGVGLLAEHGLTKRLSSALLVFAIGEVLIYAPGLLALSRFVPPGHLLLEGFWPFVPGDTLKLLLAAAALPAAWKLTQRALR